jgi:hypothetical protein
MENGNITLANISHRLFHTVAKTPGSSLVTSVFFARNSGHPSKTFFYPPFFSEFQHLKPI